MAEHERRRQAWPRLKSLAAALLIAALGGCELIPDGADRDERPPVEAAPPPPETQAPPQARADERNLVAVLVPLSGENAPVGRSIANAANMALLDAGSDDIRLSIYDTARGGAAAAANEALADGAGLFLGPLLAEDVQAAAPVARRASVPVLAFSNDSSVAGNGVYVLGFTPAQSIERVTRYARSRNLARFAALVPEGEYGRRAYRALYEELDGGRGEVVAMQEYPRNSEALREAARKLNVQAGFDAVLIADNGRIAGVAAPLIRRGPSSRAQILGTELWNVEAGLGENEALRGAWFAAVPDTMFEQLGSRYRARYGSAPYRLASLGYDAVLLAIRVGEAWDRGARFPERELVDPGGFSGVDGPFRFMRSGLAERALQVEEVTATGPRIVSPAPARFD
ncbi:MAG: penicillin-binding protein activator [Sphingomonadaceae bacterium]